MHSLLPINLLETQLVVTAGILYLFMLMLVANVMSEMMTL